MIPNLSKEWIKKLRDELKGTMTTSTCFNSPPGTERACFEEAQEYDVETHLKLA
jgi:hypothetical protein